MGQRLSKSVPEVSSTIATKLKYPPTSAAPIPKPNVSVATDFPSTYTPSKTDTTATVLEVKQTVSQISFQDQLVALGDRSRRQFTPSPDLKSNSDSVETPTSDSIFEPITGSQDILSVPLRGVLPEPKRSMEGHRVALHKSGYINHAHAV